MLNDSELARRNGSSIELRPTGLRVAWDLADLSTADGHSARATFACIVHALPDATERKMLEEALLSSRSVVTASDVAAHFAASLQSAARRFASTQPAESLLGDPGRRDLLAALMEAAGAVAFTCGVETIPPTQLDLDCPSLARARMETLQLQIAQKRVAERVDHLKRSAELFDEFESIRAKSPDLLPGQILSRVGIADQADVLRSLLATSAAHAAPKKLWAVAGNNLVEIDTRAESLAPRLIALPLDLGPLRSIQKDDATKLLLGCRGGIMRIAPDAIDKATLYRCPTQESPFGFNAAVVTATALWATHGQVGLVRWKLDQPDKPDLIVTPTDSGIPGFSPRNLQSFSADRLILISDRQLLIATADGKLQPIGSPSEEEIATLIVQDKRILTIHDDGSVAIHDRQDFQIERQQRRSGRVTSAAALPWLADARILLAAEDGPVLCIGPDDELLTQFTSPHRGLRMLAGAADSVAAVTNDRQRLILWHAWDGRGPRAEFHLFSATRHRIADVAFV